MLGKGLLKGMAVTAKNFVESYYDDDRMITVQYPEEPSVRTETYRNFPFLVYDGAPDHLRCVACKICENECPPQCIYIEVDRDAAGKVLKRPKVFDIDVSVCMSCQICVETCPFDAIKMDNEFEMARDDRFDGFLLKKDQLLKSNEYYHEIRPQEATDVDKRLAAKKKPAAAAPSTSSGPSAKPVAAAAPAAAKPAAPAIVVPEDAPFSPEQREWLAKFLSTISVAGGGKSEISNLKSQIPAEAAPAEEAPAAAEESAGDPDMVDSSPWHDPDKSLAERMKLAQGKSLAAKLFAAMGQTDCTACGYDCKGYAAALAAGTEKDPGLCVPGAEETEAKVKDLLEEAGKNFARNDRVIRAERPRSSRAMTVEFTRNDRGTRCAGSPVKSEGFAWLELRRGCEVV